MLLAHWRDFTLWFAFEFVFDRIGYEAGVSTIHTFQKEAYSGGP